MYLHMGVLRVHLIAKLLRYIVVVEHKLRNGQHRRLLVGLLVLVVVVVEVDGRYSKLHCLGYIPAK